MRWSGDEDYDHRWLEQEAKMHDYMPSFPIRVRDFWPLSLPATGDSSFDVVQQEVKPVRSCTARSRTE